jgi:hypothetical protein
MSADKRSGTGFAVSSYVEWVLRAGNHQTLFDEALVAADGMPERAFEILYRSMRVVRSFGRMARFDYLTMIAKLRIAEIKPGSAYIAGSTGPQAGAREMFQVPNTRRLSVRELDERVIQMSRHLNMGLQEMEDSICNWQKSPRVYKYFAG